MENGRLFVDTGDVGGIVDDMEDAAEDPKSRRVEEKRREGSRREFEYYVGTYIRFPLGRIIHNVPYCFIPLHDTTFHPRHKALGYKLAYEPSGVDRIFIRKI